MAGLGIAGLGPTCEVKVEVRGWEGKQQHPIYQHSRGRAAFPDPGGLMEHFPTLGQRCRTPRDDPIPGSILGDGRGRHTHPGEGKPFPLSYSLLWVPHQPAHPQGSSQKSQLRVAQPAFPLAEPAWVRGAPQGTGAAGRGHGGVS